MSTNTITNQDFVELVEKLTAALKKDSFMIKHHILVERKNHMDKKLEFVKELKSKTTEDSTERKLNEYMLEHLAYEIKQYSHKTSAYERSISDIDKIIHILGDQKEFISAGFVETYNKLHSDHVYRLCTYADLSYSQLHYCPLPEEMSLDGQKVTKLDMHISSIYHHLRSINNSLRVWYS